MGDYFNLGSHSRTITTTSQEAQTWFDRGLNWCYAFNHEEALVCFKKVLEHDPISAMAYWGIAYASGPFYNMPWRFFCETEAEECTHLCYQAINSAMGLSDNASEQEKALIEALAQRFQADHPVSQDEFNCWDTDYANAMRRVYQCYGHDLDIATLFAEAMMTRTPWKLWDIKTGEVAQGSDTLEVIEVLERAMRTFKDRATPAHPGILHMYIHVMEMSPRPVIALPAADQLFGLSPDAGHLQHMPAHIYVLCAKYQKAIQVSNVAIEADNKFLDYAGPFNFYTTALCHDLHMKMYAAMLSGHFQFALQASRAISKILSKDVLTRPDKPYLAMTLEGYYSMSTHVLVRFGRWQEIIDLPMPDDSQLYCVTTAMHHYAKGVAYAALGQIGQAERERGYFNQAYAVINKERIIFNNPAHNVLSVAQAMLNGELEYHKKNYPVAFDFLREAVRRNDDLLYTEPWAWMHPPCHALGALLLAQDQVEEAYHVYRADLGLDSRFSRPCQHPDNIWSLHGYLECLKKMALTDQIKQYQEKLDSALTFTDRNISASCCCRNN